MPNFPHKLGPSKPNSVPPVHAPGVLERLTACQGLGDDFDRHVVGCTLAAAMSEGEYHSLTEALGLDRQTIGEILDTMFPGAFELDAICPPGATRGDDAIEEPDFRDLLYRHRTAGTPIEDWLVSIIVRRCQAGDHMWRSIGLFSRKELTQAMHRYFGPLASKNVRDMKWKKFIYRQMCEEEGLSICKAPVCDVCPDLQACLEED